MITDARICRSLKAYKLGKRRWSYNQCQLIVQQEDGDEQLNVMEAMANGNESIQGEYQVYQVSDQLSCPPRGMPADSVNTCSRTARGQRSHNSRKW